jgi:transposase
VARQEGSGDLAVEAIKRIDTLFDIERGINGQSAERRLRARSEQSTPVVAALEAWLREQRSRLSRSSSVAEPIDYMLRRWIGLPASSMMGGSA